jgi:hypothetical protein
MPRFNLRELLQTSKRSLATKPTQEHDLTHFDWKRARAVVDAKLASLGLAEPKAWTLEELNRELAGFDEHYLQEEAQRRATEIEY